MSSTSPWIPSAIFLLIIDPQINGIESMIPVTSLSEYILRSAGQIFSVWAIMQRPWFSTIALNSWISNLVWKPGIVSSLSMVPPVWPRLRPAIMGIASPAAAIKGARIRDTLSPTPPVECLSAIYESISENSICSPELSITSVKAMISSSVIPLVWTAFRNEIISSSLILPLT